MQPIENTQQNSLSALNQHISARIYQRFTQGRVINKLTFNRIKSSWVEDKDYTYIFRYQHDFALLYALIGKKLVHNVKGEFYYIDNMTDTDKEEADEHALKTQSCILVLGRHFELSGRGIQQLGDMHTGFNNKHLQELNKTEEYSAICRALKFQKWEKAAEYLVNRGFAFSTDSESFVLSSAGMAFCYSVIEAYEQR